MIETVKAWITSMDRNDKMFIATTLATLIAWWVFIGHKRYSTRGMTK